MKLSESKTDGPPIKTLPSTPAASTEATAPAATKGDPDPADRKYGHVLWIFVTIS